MSDAAATVNTPFKVTKFDQIDEMVMNTSASIHQGSGVAVGSNGKIVHASQAGALYTLGVAEETILAAAAGTTIKSREGIARFANDAGHLVSIANRLGPCYWTDDQTIGTDSSKLLAGVVYDVDAYGVWVIMGPMLVSAASVGALLAANNLNDVADAAAALENLGVGLTDTPTFAGLVVSGAMHAKRETFTPSAGAYTVLNANGDQTIRCGTDNDVVTLTDIAAANKGMRVTVINVAADDAAKVSISPHSSDKIKGTVAAVSSGAVADKDWINTKSGSNNGDYTTLESDGTDSWYIVGGVGVWASQP